MRHRLRNAWWSLMDPVLRRFQARWTHLWKVREPLADPAAMWDLADADPTVTWMLDANAMPCGDKRRIRIGAHSTIRGTLNVVAPTGHIHLGSHCYVGSGAQLWSQVGIDIGNRVLISHLVDIHDTDAHPLQAAARARETIALLERHRDPDWSIVRCEPIRIEDDAWLGFKSSVLKGVTIGRGAIVAACSVVTKDVAANSIVAGNPARVVGHAPD